MATSTAAPPSTGLAKASMSPFEVLSQSVAGIAPSAVMATGPALVALNAGSSLLYSYVFSTIILLMVGWCIAQFAKRRGTGTTLLSYIHRALGPFAGFVGAICSAFGYVMIGLASLGGLVLYTQPLLDLVKVPGATSIGVSVVVMVVAMALASFSMVRGVQISTRIGVVLEVLSVLCILAVIVAVLATSGFSSAPLSPPELSASGVAGGMVLAILGYVGFESAANMGTEASNPQRTIPRAVIGSVVIVGLLYLLSGYAQLVGLGSGEALAVDAAPFNTLADGAGVHALGYVVDLGAVASFFACITGSLNAASRLLHSMGSRGLLPRVVGGTHVDHRTPHVAILTLAGLLGVLGVVATIFGMEPILLFALAGTIGTYGYMVAYILVTAGLGLFLMRRSEPATAAYVVGAIATLGMLYVLYRNVFPIPAAPYTSLPFAFAGVVVAAATWFVVVHTRGDVDPLQADDELHGVEADLAAEPA